MILICGRFVLSTKFRKWNEKGAADFSTAPVDDQDACGSWLVNDAHAIAVTFLMRTLRCQFQNIDLDYPMHIQICSSLFLARYGVVREPRYTPTFQCDSQSRPSCPCAVRTDTGSAWTGIVWIAWRPSGILYAWNFLCDGTRHQYAPLLTFDCFRGKKFRWYTPCRHNGSLNFWAWHQHWWLPKASRTWLLGEQPRWEYRLCSVISFRPPCLASVRPCFSPSILICQCRTPHEMPIQVSSIPKETLLASGFTHRKHSVRIDFKNESWIDAMSNSFITYFHATIRFSFLWTLAVAVIHWFMVVLAIFISWVVPVFHEPDCINCVHTILDNSRFSDLLEIAGFQSWPNESP